jgi:hypothetical protein
MKRLFAILMMVAIVVAVNAQQPQRMPVKVADLPKAISEYIAKDFAGFTMKDATKIVTNNVATYEVAVIKGTAEETLLFYKDGKFMKKVTAKEGTVEKKNPVPPAQPKTVVKK